MTMRHNCLGSCYMTTHMWDFAIFDGCFTPKIKPTDVDGLVERNGRFLLIETKGKDVQDLTRGQAITYQALAELGVFTILVMFGDRNCPQRAMIIRENGDFEHYLKTDLEEMREVVADWFAYANGVEAWH
jgi:hypothetical protein